MASTQHFTIDRSFTGDAGELLAREADAARWAEWASVPMRSFRWAQSPPPDLGEGAVRRLAAGPIAIVERTVSYVPGESHTYSMDPLATVRNYLATLTVRPNDGGGGELTWSVSFDTVDPVSGPLLRLAMRRTIAQLADRLVASTEG